MARNEGFFAKQRTCKDEELSCGLFEGNGELNCLSQLALWVCRARLLISLCFWGLGFLFQKCWLFASLITSQDCCECLRFQMCEVHKLEITQNLAEDVMGREDGKSEI